MSRLIDFEFVDGKDSLLFSSHLPLVFVQRMARVVLVDELSRHRDYAGFKNEDCIVDLALRSYCLAFLKPFLLNQWHKL